MSGSVDEEWLRSERRYRGVPSNLFKLLAGRERKRLIYQLRGRESGRRQTLYTDDAQDLDGNSENNIRQCWISQGIWKEEWGNAWTAVEDRVKGWHPHGFQGPYIAPNARWQHEQPEGMISNDLDMQTKAPDATYDTQTSSIDASRPLHQFKFLVSRERDWLVDELAWKGQKNDNIDAAAYQAVKVIWQEASLWQSLWEDLPGLWWAHEVESDVLDSTKRDELSSGMTATEIPAPRLHGIDTNEQPESSKHSFAALPSDSADQPSVMGEGFWKSSFRAGMLGIDHGRREDDRIRSSRHTEQGESVPEHGLDGITPRSPLSDDEQALRYLRSLERPELMTFVNKPGHRKHYADRMWPDDIVATADGIRRATSADTQENGERDEGNAASTEATGGQPASMASRVRRQSQRLKKREERKSRSVRKPARM